MAGYYSTMVSNNFNLAQLSPLQKKLRLDILKVSFEQRYSHLGSCLTAVDAIEVVYQIKREQDVFVLSNGHAGVAWYTVLMNHGFMTYEQLKKLNIHPDRNPQLGIEVSTGSLGQGLPIALGLALADPNRTVYCMISDGECAEGSIWESLRVISDHQVKNLVLILNANGWGAYDRVETEKLTSRISAFGLEIRNAQGHNLEDIKVNLTKPITQTCAVIINTENNQLPFIKNQDAHYYVMNEQDWQIAQELLT